jgi:hypothetical protein
MNNARINTSEYTHLIEKEKKLGMRNPVASKTLVQCLYTSLAVVATIRMGKSSLKENLTFLMCNQARCGSETEKVIICCLVRFIAGGRWYAAVIKGWLARDN